MERITTQRIVNLNIHFYHPNIYVEVYCFAKYLNFYRILNLM